jgi:hypothetical protein
MNTYDWYLQECNAWFESENTFVESHIVIEGDEDDAFDETNHQSKDIHEARNRKNYEFLKLNKTELGLHFC